MADPEAAVTDTHPLVFHAAGGRGLGPKAAAFFARCERQEAILYVPTIVIWECSLLARVSRINLRRSVRAFFDDLFSNPSYQPLDVTPEHVFLADEAAVQSRSVRCADLRGGQNRRASASDARWRHPQLRRRAGHLVTDAIHWTIARCTSAWTAACAAGLRRDSLNE